MWFVDANRRSDVEHVCASTLICWLSYWLLLPICQTFFPPTHAKADPLVDVSRMVSTVHDLVAATVATHVWWMGTDELNPLPHWVLSMSLGYFLWDLLLCLLYPRKMGYDMLIHAVVCTAGYTLAMQPCMTYEATALLLFEWSTPFLHAYRLAQSYQWSLKWQLYLSLTFAAMFFLFRIVWGTYFVFLRVLPQLYVHYSQGRISGAMACVASTIVLGSFGLNVMWFRRMLQVFAGNKKKSR